MEKIYLLLFSVTAAAFAFAAGPVGVAGQVRGFPETRVAYGTAPREAFSFYAVKLAEKSFMGTANGDAAFDYGKFAADAAFAYDEKNLYVSLATKGIDAEGEVILVSGGRICRAPIGGAAGTSIAIPWTRLVSGGLPSGDVHCAFDLAWKGLGRKTLLALSQPMRFTNIHTSFAALTASPQFRVDAHLPEPKQWGKVVFGGGRDAVRKVETAEVVDLTALAAAETTPAVDGDLADWDRESFAISSFLGNFLKGRYSVKLATAFDAKFLYVAAYVVHPDGRPVNSAPAATGAGYGGGDALQLRVSDGKDLRRSFCAWKAPEGPALTVDTKDLKERDILARGGKLAFGTWKNGYTMEIAIPWSAIGRRAKAGDEWRLTFQPWWNAASERFTFLTSLAFERPPAKSVAFAPPRAGAVSLGVFDAKGALVRTLLRGEWRERGAANEPWDLKDQFGTFVAPGEYVLKGLVTDGIGCDYRYTLGNPGKPAWPTPDGRGDWLSDEAPPQGVATDGETVFVAAPGSEKGFAVMAIDRDGNRLWGVGEEFYPRCVSLSYLDGRLYALFSGPIADKPSPRGRAVLIAYDAKTGKRVGFSATNARTELGERWPYREDYHNLYDLIAAKSFAPENYIGQPRYFDQDVGETDNAIGFAALPGVFAVSKFYDDRIELYDATTLELKGRIDLEKPAGLCRLDDKTILAISGRRVVKIDISSFEHSNIQTFTHSNLSAPVGLAVDRQGVIYVSDWRDQMQVKKFAADGTYLGEVGRKGGRPWIGAFDFGGMLLPHGLAVMDDGLLFVAEADNLPKRLSCWDAKSGKFLRHWVGPAPYGGMSNFWVDRAEPGYYHTSGSKFRYDEKTGASEVVATEFRRMSHDQPFMPHGASCMGTGVKVVDNEHGKFLCLGSRNRTVWMRRVGDTFVPCAAIGGLHSMVTDDGTGLVCWDSDIGRHMYRNRRPECFRGHSGKRGFAGDNYSWSDLNGDGLVQADEMRWHQTLGRGGTWSDGVQYEYYNGWGAQFAADGTAHWAGFARDFDVIMELKPERWTKYGPVYDINKAVALHKEPTEGGSFSGVYTTEEGEVFAIGCVAGGMRMKTRTAISAFGKDGRLRWEWAASPTAGARDFAASGVNGRWDVPGLGAVLCTWNWWWNYRPYFFTTDGLYVGTFGEETSLGPAALWSESATYYFQTADGTPYLVNGANQSHHVFEVKGLANAKRFTGRVSVAAAELEKAKADERIPVKREEPKPVIALDGSSVRVDGGKGRAFTASAKIDYASGRLLIAADVDDPTPMLQKGTDYRTLFITGDSVDFMFAADPKAPEGRRAPAFGDRRLCLSEMDGKPVAVLFEPVTEPRAEKPQQLMAAKIDRITLLKDAEVKIVRRSVGYVLTASVPLATLGLQNIRTFEHSNILTSLRGDLGVIFSGAIGGRELRLYRYNKNTFMTADLTTEATLQPAEWGEMLVPPEANLIKDPSFENGDGWEMSLVPEGDRAEYADLAHTGTKSLFIETRGHVSVGQTVKLPEGADGKTARLRLFMRSEGLKPEDRQAKDKPGAWASVWVFFRGADHKALKSVCAYTKNMDSWDWLPAKRSDTPGPADAIDLEIPSGAVDVRIDFKITTRGLDRPARVWFDAAELSVAN